MTSHLLEDLAGRFIARIGQTLEDPDLTPDQLSRLGNCFARQQQAFAWACAQKIANARYAHDRLLWKQKEAADRPRKTTLADKVRRIYGIEAPELAHIEVNVPADEYTEQEEATLRAKGALP